MIATDPTSRSPTIRESPVSGDSCGDRAWTNSLNSGMFSSGRCPWSGPRPPTMDEIPSMTSGSVADCPCARHHRTVADIVPERPELRSMGCPRPRVHRQLVASSRRCDSTPHPSGSRAFSRFMRPWKSSARADLPSRRIDIESSVLATSHRHTAATRRS